MRVLMLSDVYFPRINGVSTSIESFRLALAREGIFVHLVAPAYPHAHTSESTITRIPSFPVPFDREDRCMRYPALTRALETLNETFDLVHVQTPFLAHYAGVGYARRRKLPCVTTWHTHFEDYLHHYLPFAPKRLLRRWVRYFARRQCNALDAIIVPSQAIYATLRDYGVEKPIHRIPTGIPHEHFHRPTRPEGARAFRLSHAIPLDAPVALYVGRAAHEKNIGFLLESLAHALPDCPRLILVIAGEGPALPDLRQRAASLAVDDNVRFVGYLDRHRELPHCYAAADLFVFASRTETQGLVLLEALACGLPVLAISALGTREIVEPRRGALPAAETPAAFARQLVELLADPSQRRAMAQEGQRFAREWSIEATAHQLAELYRKIIHTFATPPIAHERPYAWR